MKRILLAVGSAGVLLFASHALADGMPSRAVPVSIGCAGPFSGLYIGANVGVAEHTSTWHDVDGWFDGQQEKKTDRGNVYGLQAGYDHQCGRSVFGFVADWTWANQLKSDTTYADGDITLREDVHQFATLRARAGLALDKTLFYVTGGAAFVDLNHRTIDNRIPADEGGLSRMRLGLTVGAGVELAYFDRFTVNAEALYVDFASKSFSATDDPTFSFDHSDTMWVARIGLNYRFGDRERVAAIPLK
jgi:outer membrane immunogenic protein